MNQLLILKFGGIGYFAYLCGRILFLLKTEIMKKIVLLLLLTIPCLCMGQIEVPMEKQEGGTYLIPCKVNGVPMKFIFDTGASVVNISMTEALFLIKNGHIQKTDIKGTSYAQIANGDIVENTTNN